jgi:hypothetical protein
MTKNEFRIVENALKFVISHELGCAGNELAEDCVQDLSYLFEGSSEDRKVTMSPPSA